MSNFGQTSSATTRGGTLSDLAQQFTTGANPGGYTLTGVELKLSSTTGAGPPTVTLHSGSAHGTKVADFDGPAAVPVGATVETFTPTTAVTLSASTDYWVVIEGGSSDMAWSTTTSDAEDAGSAGGWTVADVFQSRTASSTGSFADHSTGNAGVLRIYGRITPPPNAAATGAPTIGVPNVLRVPAVLTADISGIADSNGVTNIAHRAAYTWQRFAADGTTLEADDIGTGQTYRLTDADADADAGKRIKLSFSFTDDARYAEGALTSAATDAVTAAAACVEPTLTGGATFIE